MNEPIEDYIINFLARKESPEDVQKLKEWLAADPSRRDELKQWLAAWDVAGIHEASKNINAEDAYRRFLFRANAETAPKISPKGIRTNVVFQTILRMAAIFVICFSLGMAGYYYWTKKQTERIAFIEKNVPQGSKSEINLPDGSMVWLNAGSTLRYRSNYGKNNRDIYLAGEGYFKVVSQTGKPFTVHTTLANITVLGTEFNVKAYADENLMETILMEGELAVENCEGASASKCTVLKAGQKCTITATEQQPVITLLEPDVAEACVSWKERIWRIESVTLQDLSVQLERRFDVRIKVDDQLKERRFTGTFANESLEQILIIIQHSIPFRFKIEGKNVNIDYELRIQD